MTTETLIALQPYKYQRDDVELLKRPEYAKCILGHQMRVGKTIEVLMLARDLGLENILVVCPKSVVPVWPYEAERWFGKEFADRFVVMNYEKLLRDDIFALLTQTKWDLIVYDEAHKLKNPKAKRTKAAVSVAARSKRLLLASGTIQQNGPQDLFSPFHMIDPVTFPKYIPFINEYCIQTRLPKYPFPTIIVGAKNKEKLAAELSKRMIRRRLIDVQPDLPPILSIETIPIELGDEQLLKYMQMEEELFVMLDNGEKINAPCVLAQRLRLRQICLEPNLLSENNKISSPSAKTLAMLEALDSRGKDEGKTLIFTYFEKYARILQTEIVKTGMPCGIYTGQESSEERLSIYRKFQDQEEPRVLVGTIGAMSLGLTLTRADVVMMPDWWWNPAVNDQAIYRTQGTGQIRPVHVLDFWAKGTIEDAMHRTLAGKQKMFTDIVDADIAAIEELRRMRSK
jgi:SNF2 family DNA or RNA helicase